MFLNILAFFYRITQVFEIQSEKQAKKYTIREFGTRKKRAGCFDNHLQLFSLVFLYMFMIKSMTTIAHLRVIRPTNRGYLMSVLAPNKRDIEKDQP